MTKINLRHLRRITDDRHAYHLVVVNAGDIKLLLDALEEARKLIRIASEQAWGCAQTHYGEQESPLSDTLDAFEDRFTDEETK